MQSSEHRVIWPGTWAWRNSPALVGRTDGAGEKDSGSPAQRLWS